MLNQTETLINIKRVSSSINGNPNFLLYFTNNIVIKTKNDNGINYAISDRLLNKELDLTYKANKKSYSLIDFKLSTSKKETI